MSKGLFIFGLVISLASMVFALDAYGQGQEKKQKGDCVGTFMQVNDKDKSGFVDTKEITQTARNDFKKLDTNNDGVINKKDKKSFLKEADIVIIDKDKNGDITMEEYVIYFTDNFKKVDINKDGKITKDEVEKHCKEKASK